MSARSKKEEVSEVEAWVIRCREAYLQTRKSSLEAASYIYLVWRASCGPEADQAARRDIERAIEKTNKEIVIDNGRMKRLRGLGVRVRDNQKIEDKEFEALEDDHRDKFDARHFASLTPAKFKEGLFVKIDFDESKDDSTRLAVVKHALLLKTNRERSRASRYAKVVEWIDCQFAEISRDELSFDAIVDALDRAGGFDEVIVKQRAKTNPAGRKSKAGNIAAAAASHDDADVVREAAERGFKAQTFDVSVKLPDHLASLPDGRLSLECVLGHGVLTILECTVRSDDEPSADSSDDSPALQPEQIAPTQQKNQLTPTT